MSEKDNSFKALDWEDPITQDLGSGVFLRLTRSRVRHCLVNGDKGPWYDMEAAHTPFHDAVVLVLFAPDPDQGLLVGLRRNVRPATALRSLRPELAQMDGAIFSGALWELPAGGVEDMDMAPQGGGLVGCACRETWEEMGLRLTPRDFFSLGPAPFASPSFCHERLHYLAAQVDPSRPILRLATATPWSRPPSAAFSPWPRPLIGAKRGASWISRPRWACVAWPPGGDEAKPGSQEPWDDRSVVSDSLEEEEACLSCLSRLSPKGRKAALTSRISRPNF